MEVRQVAPQSDLVARVDAEDENIGLFASMVKARAQRRKIVPTTLEAQLVHLREGMKREIIDGEVHAWAADNTQKVLQAASEYRLTPEAYLQVCIIAVQYRCHLGLEEYRARAVERGIVLAAKTDAWLRRQLSDIHVAEQRQVAEIERWKAEQLMRQRLEEERAKRELELETEAALSRIRVEEEAAKVKLKTDAQEADTIATIRTAQVHDDAAFNQRLQWIDQMSKLLAEVERVKASPRFFEPPMQNKLWELHAQFEAIKARLDEETRKGGSAAR